MSKSEPRRCAGTNRHGKPCRTPWQFVDVDGFCPVHVPGADVDTLVRRASAAATVARRERAKSVAQLLRERFEREADAVYLEIRAAIDAGDRNRAVDIVDRALSLTPAQASRAEVVRAANLNPDSEWVGRVIDRYVEDRYVEV